MHNIFTLQCVSVNLLLELIIAIWINSTALSYFYKGFRKIRSILWYWVLEDINWIYYDPHKTFEINQPCF